MSLRSWQLFVYMFVSSIISLWTFNNVDYILYMVVTLLLSTSSLKQQDLKTFLKNEWNNEQKKSKWKVERNETGRED